MTLGRCPLSIFCSRGTPSKVNVCDPSNRPRKVWRKRDRRRRWGTRRTRRRQWCLRTFRRSRRSGPACAAPSTRSLSYVPSLSCVPYSLAMPVVCAILAGCDSLICCMRLPGCMPSAFARRGNNLKGANDLTCNPRPEYGLDCLICARIWP